MTRYRVGDAILYHKPKSSTSPGPRAKQVYALERGESYHYVVDKFWKVSAVHDDGSIDAVTRTGKRHRLQCTDPNLRKAPLYYQLLYKKRFPTISGEH